MCTWPQQQHLSIAGSHLSPDDVLGSITIELVGGNGVDASCRQRSQHMRHPPRGCDGHRVAGRCDQAEHEVLIVLLPASGTLARLGAWSAFYGCVDGCGRGGSRTPRRTGPEIVAASWDR
jgi:hypothetical protein